MPSTAALKALDETRFDCLVLDLGLPDQGGIDLIREAALSSHRMSTGAARQIGRECAIDDDLVTHGQLGVT